MNTEHGPGVFATTHWSVVLAAGDELSSRRSQALEQLCRAYWYPLYAYIRRRGHDEHEAKDLTQGFFVHLLSRNSVAVADANRGRFRTFLLASLNHFLANEWDKAHRIKRGGGLARVSLDDDAAEARFQLEAPGGTPEAQFDRSWAEATMDSVRQRFRQELAESGDLERYECLQPILFGDEHGSYAEAAARLGISETGVRSVVHRFRKRFREIVRAEIAQTVSHPDEIEGEIRHLFAALA